MTDGGRRPMLWLPLLVAMAMSAGCEDVHTPSDAGDVDTAADDDSGADTTVDTEAAATGAVQGYVVLQGQVDHSAVSVVIDDTSLMANSAGTGFWSISHVPPGTYIVTASRAGYVSATSSPFQVRAGETTTVPPLSLAEAKGSLSGTALLADRDTHAGITVSVEGTSYVALTAASGAWSITDVPVGNYAIRARHPGYDDAVASDQQVLAGQNTTVPTLTLRVTTSSISGTVTLEGATDHSGASVVATATWNPTITRASSTNAAGAYTISGVEPGFWNVVASKTNWVSATRENVRLCDPADGRRGLHAGVPTCGAADVVGVRLGRVERW